MERISHFKSILRYIFPHSYFTIDDNIIETPPSVDILVDETYEVKLQTINNENYENNEKMNSLYSLPIEVPVINLSNEQINSNNIYIETKDKKNKKNKNKDQVSPSKSKIFWMKTLRNWKLIFFLKTKDKQSSTNKSTSRLDKILNYFRNRKNRTNLNKQKNQMNCNNYTFKNEENQHNSDPLLSK